MSHTKMPAVPAGSMVLTLDHLRDHDGGKPAALFESLLNAAVRDCVDRKADPSKREVVFKVSLKPELAGDGVLDTIQVTFTGDVKLPRRQTKPYAMLPTSAGGLTFQPESPHDPRQSPLPYHTATEEPNDDD